MNKAQAVRWGSIPRWGVLGALLLVCLFFRIPSASAEDTLDLSKAVKIGSGKIMVIEFTDPDCPFCRKAEAYFRQKKDVTRYIFFLPLSSHRASKGKVQYILSATDKAKAYLEVTSGAFDQQKLSEITPEGIKLQEEHVKIVKANNISSTPSFMIYGRIVVGFDVKALEQLIP